MLSQTRIASTRTISWVVGWLADIARQLLEAATFSAMPQRDVQGFRVFVIRSRIADEDVFVRVDAALVLIAIIDPRRFARMRMDVRQIVVTSLANADGAYVARSQTCYLNEARVGESDSSTVARILVHEATHARLEHAGVRPWRDRKDRYERVCSMQEVAFASKLPLST